MVRVVLTGRVRASKSQAGMEFAKEVTSLFNRKYPSHHVTLLRPISGNSATLTWVVDYKDLAEAEEIGAKFNADEEYMQLLAKISDDSPFTDDGLTVNYHTSTCRGSTARAVRLR